MKVSILVTGYYRSNSTGVENQMAPGESGQFQTEKRGPNQQGIAELSKQSIYCALDKMMMMMTIIKQTFIIC